MKENAKKQPTKKKKLLYWLSLAACLLIIAAITVGVIFAVNGSGQNLTADNKPSHKEDKGDENPPDDGGDDDGGSVDTSSMYEFIPPIDSVDLQKAHEFCWDETMGWYAVHQAMDFSAPAGTKVLAAVDGTVKSVTKNDYLNYAVVTIEHANNLTTVYKFLDPNENLKDGDKVSRGQVIGTIAAASGVERADGEHLHFEVYKEGKIVDPDDYLHLNAK